MTSTEIFNKQYPLALAALADHIATHQLPAPTSIDTVDYHRFGPTPTSHDIRLRLPALAKQQAAWIASVVVDREDSHEVELGFRLTWSVRLPDTGFRFTLVALRCHSLRSVVPA